jgi:hypothetical protein
MRLSSVCQVRHTHTAYRSTQLVITDSDPISDNITIITVGYQTVLHIHGTIQKTHILAEIDMS